MQSIYYGYIAKSKMRSSSYNNWIDFNLEKRCRKKADYDG